MTFRALQSEAEHKAALKEAAALMESDPEPCTPDGDRLDILVALVQAYEAKLTSIGAPDPAELTKSRATAGRPQTPKRVPRC